MRRLLWGLLVAACAVTLSASAQNPLVLLGVSNGPASSGAGATPALVEVFTDSNTLANALGTTVNACPTQTYCGFLPEATLSGQAIIGCVTYSESPTATITITDDGGNTYSLADTADDTTNTKKVTMFYALNVASGTRQIKVKTAANNTQVGINAAVFYNVATSSALDVHSVGTSGSGSSTMAAGSLTPSTSTDLLVQCGRRTQTKGVTSFTAGSQTNITWALATADNEDGLVMQWGQYTANTAISPQLTMASTSGYATVAAAFTTATAGSDFAAGMHIRGVHQFNFVPGELSSSPVKVQVPTRGNLEVVTSVFGGSTTCAINGGSDTASNTYSNAATPIGDSANGRAGIAYAQNATASLTDVISVTISSPGALCDATILVYDVTGAATSSFIFANGSDLDTSTGGPANWTWFNGAPTTPSVTSGIAFWAQGNSTDTTQSSSAPCTTVDQAYFGGETISGSGTEPPGENNGWGHCAFSSNTQQTWTTGFASTVATSVAYMTAVFSSSSASSGTIALDNFDRANGAISSSGVSNTAIWAVESGKPGGKVVSNAWQPNGFNLDDGNIYVGRTFPANQAAQCTLGTITGSGGDSGGGLLLRAATGSQTEYRILSNASASTNTYIDRMNSGTEAGGTFLASGTKSGGWGSGDVLYAIISGTGSSTNIIVKSGGAGGTSIINFTDSSCGANCINSGSPGVTYSSTITAWNCADWSGGL